MKAVSCVLALGFLFLSVGSADEAVVTLTTDNFDEFVANNERVLVEFYAPWCGHCKALAPEYEKAAQQLKDESATTVLAKVDATIEKDLAGKFGIRGFPTLKYFTGDAANAGEYGGGRTQDTIVSWVKKREMPAVSGLETTDQAQAFVKSDRVVLVGYFDGDGEAANVLKSVGDAMRDELVTGHVPDKSVADAMGVSYPSLVLYTNFGDETESVEFDGDLENKEAVDGFVQSERFPLIDQIGPENYQAYMGRGLPLLWIPLDPADSDAKSQVHEVLTPYAKEFKGQLSFVWINSVQYKQYVESLGVADGAFIIIADTGEKFKFANSLDDADELKTFFSQYGEGTLEKFLKSEPVPESNDEPVFVLVGKTFPDVVGQDKDVFVEFYAPWCGHCKKLAPEWEKVGEAFKDVDSVVVAKMDATQNDSPEQIQGFPTLVFYPAQTSEGVRYEGDRTTEAMVKWLKEKATDSEAVAEAGVKEEL